MYVEKLNNHSNVDAYLLTIFIYIAIINLYGMIWNWLAGMGQLCHIAHPILLCTGRQGSTWYWRYQCQTACVHWRASGQHHRKPSWAAGKTMSWSSKYTCNILWIRLMTFCLKQQHGNSTGFLYPCIQCNIYVIILLFLSSNVIVLCWISLIVVFIFVIIIQRCRTTNACELELVKVYCMCGRNAPQKSTRKHGFHERIAMILL